MCGSETAISRETGISQLEAPDLTRGSLATPADWRLLTSSPHLLTRGSRHLPTPLELI